jgi:stress-induced morphogen
VRAELTMPKLQTRKTAETRKIEKLLREHFADFPPEYPPEAYRYNSACIRVRVVSPIFEEMDLSERSKLVYPLLKDNLPEETWWDITMILLFAPDELADSVANHEFENPTPSRL